MKKVYVIRHFDTGIMGDNAYLNYADAREAIKEAVERNGSTSEEWYVINFDLV